VSTGLHPNSPPGDFSDSNGDPDGDGDSNLEGCLNWLAAPHVDCVRKAPVDVDLAQFTRCFTNNPGFALSNPTNGAVTILTGARTARFTATSNFYGLGGFRFMGTEAQGSSLTNSIGIHVRAFPQSQLGMLFSNGAPNLQFRRGRLLFRHPILGRLGHH